MSEVFTIGGQGIPTRSQVLVELPLPPLYTTTPLTMPVHVLRGRKPGPTMFISAAVHGDELNGTEIIRRLLRRQALKRLRGTLLAVPIVNVYGLLLQSRYLPDRRDLNRSFPGSEKGSLAARLAGLFMSEIVAKCDYGIDLHTGAINRSNLPQIRADLDDAETARLAEAFSVPVLLNSNLRDGSLREAAASGGVRVLLYEAGEALRFDEVAIRAGVDGIIRVMRALEMLPPLRSKRQRSRAPVVARSSSWIRSPASGLFRSICSLGQRVKVDDLIGLVDDPFTGSEVEIKAAFAGIVIGRAELPLVHEGEALFHIARFEDVKEAAEHVESFQSHHSPDDMGLPTGSLEPPIL